MGISGGVSLSVVTWRGASSCVCALGTVSSHNSVCLVAVERVMCNSVINIPSRAYSCLPSYVKVSVYILLAIGNQCVTCQWPCLVSTVLAYSSTLTMCLV